MNPTNYDIIEGAKYESSGAASTARSMVTQRWRSCDMSTIRIPLNSRKYPGLYALIDEADFELVSQYKWHPAPRGDDRIYACCVKHASSPRYIYMHRLIMDPPKGMVVDHINHNCLDNRRENLRLATHTQNMTNSRKHRPTSSIFKGVRLHRSGLWVSQITVNGIVDHMGPFTTEIEAALAYDIASRKRHGEFSVTNEDLGLLTRIQIEVMS